MLAFWMAAALAVAGAHGPAKTQQSPVGTYRLQGGPDTASEIRLNGDGRFGFWLMEGAVDLHAEGRWTAQGRQLHLVNLPKPVPPAFNAAGAAHTSEASLRVNVTSPDGHSVALIDLHVGFDSGDPVEGYTQEDGWSLPAEETRTPRWVELGLEMYGVGFTRFPVDAAKANALTFVLTPNGLGTMDFSDIEVEAVPGALLLRRAGGGEAGRYVRTKR